MNADLDVLDQLVSTLLERHQQSTAATINNNATAARESTRLNRLKSLSFRKRRNSSNRGTQSSLAAANELNLFSGGVTGDNNGGNGFGQAAAAAMPTILESGSSNLTIKPQPPQQSPTHSLDRAHGSAGVRQIINSIKNAPQRLSQSIDHHRLNDNDDDDETSNLAKNMLD